MPRDEVVAYFERYAAASRAPVREAVEVMSVEPERGRGFVPDTSAGTTRTDALVIATGAYQRPYRPRAADALPAGLLQIDVAGFRNEQSLPPGRVLIVGSGQSGCQIAEELQE